MPLWKLRYLDPFRRPDHSVGREEKTENLEAKDFAEAQAKAKEFLSKGGLVLNETHHRREQVGGLFQGAPFPGF